MDIKNPTAPCICCNTILWNINVESVSEKMFKIGEYLAKLQARTWLSSALLHLANTLLKDEESAQDNHVIACNFAKYLPI